MSICAGIVKDTSYVRSDVNLARHSMSGNEAPVTEPIARHPFHYWTDIAESIGNLVPSESTTTLGSSKPEHDRLRIKNQCEYLKDVYGLLVDLFKVFPDIKPSKDIRHIADDFLNSVSTDGHKIEDQLKRSFESQPVENGHTHPAEEILSRFMTRNKEQTISWIRSMIFTERPIFVYSVIVCLGRLAIDTESENDVIDVMTVALRHSDVAVRDAVVQFLEAWGNHRAAYLLATHKEEVSWLRDYINDVLSHHKSN